MSRSSASILSVSLHIRYGNIIDSEKVFTTAKSFLLDPVDTRENQGTSIRTVVVDCIGANLAAVKDHMTTQINEKQAFLASYEGVSFLIVFMCIYNFSLLFRAYCV